MKNNPTQEQKKILENNKKNLIVSASAGSGKTFVVIEYLIKLICEKKIPLSKFLVLTFTKAAANEMKTRLYNEILQQKPTDFLLEQIDEISQSDISTIDSFCEKVIKRNINKLDIDENFSILDEKASNALKAIAFDRAYENFYEKDVDNFNDVYFAFKKNKQMVQECILDMQTFFDSNFEGDMLADEFIANNNLLKIKGEQYLLNYVLHVLQSQKKILLEIEGLPEDYEKFRQNLILFCSQQFDGDFIEFTNKLNRFDFINMPRTKREDLEEKNILNVCKERLKNIKEITQNYADVSSDRYKAFCANDISVPLLKLYKNFIQIYKDLKKSRTALDFADLEKTVRLLLQDEQIIKSLQEKYDYIFIDEYQDTNFLQEAIIKPIAQKGNFVAVGDPKQGIYGFRNASMDIMKKDIEEFSKEEESDALFLTGNFRSDEKILNFINDIFCEVMTNDSVGIDYKNTSLLKGLSEIKKGAIPSVCVDIVKRGEERKNLSGVYSVKEDKLGLSEKYQNEVKEIARRIEQALESEIYDAKKKVFRKVQFSDIAVLFRGRNLVMQETVKFLQEKGFNIVADIKQNLLEDSEIRIILALLKLTINFNDDISLVAVMNSWFGRFSLDEILKIAKIDKERQFYEKVLLSQEQKIVDFKKDIEDFYFDCQVMGITKSLNKLFSQKNFYLHINNLPSANIKKGHINEIFKLIKGGDFEYNIPALIDYLERNQVGGEVGEQSSNAITITTIHATKGLEYPIVILAGCGERLKKTYTKQYTISKEFGLATYLYDFDEDDKVKSPSFISSKLIRDKKEFIEEIMIFYVALTRAQNHLFIIGTQHDKEIKVCNELYSCQNYIDLIFFAYGEEFVNKLCETHHRELDYVEFNLIDEIGEIQRNKNKGIKNLSQFISQKDKIEKYIDYQYENKDECFYQFKNSVSSVLHLEEDEAMIYVGSDEEREKSITRGNAYHQALEIIDFNLINNKSDLLNQKEFLKNNLLEGYYDFIDMDILWENINIIKNIIKNQTVVKERKFIMQTSLKEAQIADSEQKIIIQGVVDLFSLGEKNILIDYKFTSEKSEEKLKTRYKKQINLYALALGKAFDRKINEKYLLSLKYGKIIKIE